MSTTEQKGDTLVSYGFNINNSTFQPRCVPSGQSGDAKCGKYEVEVGSGTCGTETVPICASFASLCPNVDTHRLVNVEVDSKSDGQVYVTCKYNGYFPPAYWTETVMNEQPAQPPSGTVSGAEVRTVDTSTFSETPYWVWIIVGIAGLLVLAFIVGLFRRGKKNK